MFRSPAPQPLEKNIERYRLDGVHFDVRLDGVHFDVSLPNCYPSYFSFGFVRESDKLALYQNCSYRLISVCALKTLASWIIDGQTVLIRTLLSFVTPVVRRTRERNWNKLRKTAWRFSLASLYGNRSATLYHSLALLGSCMSYSTSFLVDVRVCDGNTGQEIWIHQHSNATGKKCYMLMLYAIC